MKEIWRYFFKLGCVGFGGPLAIVAEMQRELVERRGWLSSDEFTRAFALIKAMPGPVAYQCAVYVGRVRGQFWGGLLAGIAFMAPSFVMMLICGYLFDSYAAWPSVRWFLTGMEVSALGVIVASLKGLVRPYQKLGLFWILMALAMPCCWYASQWEPLLILGFGGTAVFLRSLQLSVREMATPLLALTAVMAKAGAMVFGTGLAIVPLLEQDVVNRYHWLSHDAFMSALAFGQVTPGPVVITATFIGYKVASWPGAVLATAAIFAPCSFHMLTWFPHAVNRLARLKWIESFILGAMAAVVASIVVTVVRLGGALHLDAVLALVMITTFYLTWRGKVPVWTLIPAGGFVILFYNWRPWL